MRALIACAGLQLVIGSSLIGQGAPARVPQGAAGGSSHPNVVLIIADDMGYGDLSSYGAPDAKTPNIDRLAREGVRFTDAYANAAVCTPTRVALITGRYQQRVGLELAFGGPAADTAGLRVSEASLPARLKTSGYSTGLFGKWHLGIKREFAPNAHGFDEFFGFLGGAVDYYTHNASLSTRHDLYEDTSEVRVPAYLTDEISKRAVQFVDRHKAGPFFLEVAYNATHWPFQPPDVPPDARKRFESILPGDTAGPTRVDYVRMLERMDLGVGKILAALDANALSQNTLVIFTNDNGGEWLSRNDPYFHGKNTLWEGGIRVPLLMRWPGRIDAGQTTAQVAITMDVTATILAATKTAPSPSLPPDGIDLVPVVGASRLQVERSVFWRIFNRTRTQRAVRSGQWKLLVDGGLGMLGTAEVVHIMLFDLKADPGERRDLAAQEPARVSQLLGAIEKWEGDVSPPRR